ncbi:LGFP repeat-containing protein [Mycobacterium neglectum]|jgi:uncharacterized protein with LGFP repeats|uniref:LGFP repeat-containing protein n=1 Tax=Mycobacterium neglectum TaxID=242737 RepID=UPI000BFEBE4B|nr:LGFP repeat-containing protein [Mycobacterium neglectum]
MSGQKSRRGTVLNRLSIGLLAVSMTLLLAPVAAAQPEADANGAITAAWEASGGDGGTLGPRNGDVYPVGQGFGQNFAGGKIFFTPETGARIMQGAILEKYESLGGPADSDLGFPTIDEGPGLAPDSRNTTFSATDKPVIFFTPATGARVVRGPINAAWDQLGGSAGVLGVPTEDEVYRGDVVSQKFTGGELTYDIRKKTFTTVPPELAAELADLQFPDDPAAAISAARRAAGGALGPLGAPEGEPYPVGKDGLRQNFAGGAIFYTPATGANVVTGQVLAKYESVGGPEGDLGFPISNEVDGGLATESRMSSFAAEDKPIIFWTPEHGAVIVRGAMAAAWNKLDGAKGAMGAPMADQTEAGGVVTQRFNGGVVSWDRSKNTFTTEPANLASELSGLEVPGQNAPDAPSAPQASDSKSDKWFTPNLWWLLALVPLVVLVGVGLMVMLRRPTGEDPFAADGSFVNEETRFDGDGESAYSGTVGAPPERATTDDDYAAAMFGDRYASGGLGSFPRSGDASLPEDDLWGAPSSVGEDQGVQEHEEEKPPAPDDESGEDDDPDAVDTAPTRVQSETALAAAAAAAAMKRDPLTDTGRHARIEVDDDPSPQRVAFLLPLDDPNEAPDGYPIKANTKSGVYWAPGSALYDDASAEIWFATEELARVNGFVADDDPVG